MALRSHRQPLIRLAIGLAATIAIAGARPVLFVERAAAADSGERVSIGVVARTVCLRVDAEALDYTVRFGDAHGPVCTRVWA